MQENEKATEVMSVSIHEKVTETLKLKALRALTL